MKSRILEALVLVVDDEPANVKLLERMLKSEGFTRILTTNDPEQAVSMFAEHQPDLVLLDLNMPGLDGFGVMERMRQSEHEGFLPVLVLTGDTSMETRWRALECGARDFITKPFDDTEIMMRIRHLLEVRILQRDMNSQNALLEKWVKDRTRQLEEAQLDAVRRLANAAELRDTDTGAHAQRIGMYCQALGRAAGLDERTCDLLLHSSPLHDIGKIAIPDRILLKPEELTHDEWTIMKTHTTIGAGLLANGASELIQTAQVIALTHHERWDGSGYPFSVKGEGVPVSGRICALADVYDAITSKRCYKPALPEEHAIDFIRRGAGTLFDPALTVAFNRVLPQFADIRQGILSQTY